MNDITEINQKHQIIFLIRHGERCDRSTNTCLSERDGITINGANKAQQYGNAFSKMFPDYGLYSTDTVRTIQTASFFRVGKQQPFLIFQPVMMAQLTTYWEYHNLIILL